MSTNTFSDTAYQEFCNWYLKIDPASILMDEDASASTVRFYDKNTGNIRYQVTQAMWEEGKKYKFQAKR
jgi:hypothetical protein